MFATRCVTCIIVLLVLVHPVTIRGQGYGGDRHWMLQPADARSAAMGRAGVALTGPAAVWNNPGAAAMQKGLSLDYSYDPWLTFIKGIDARITGMTLLGRLSGRLTAGILHRRLRLHEQLGAPDLAESDSSTLKNIGIHDDETDLYLGYRFGNFGAGLTIKRLSADRDIFEPRGSKMAWDVGFLYTRRWTYHTGYETVLRSRK